MTDSSTSPTVTRSDIAKGLRHLGIEAGAGLIVHSSLKSFGRVEGGARTVIEALTDVVTPDGTIVIPSFNHGGAFGDKGAGYYHPGETRSSNGPSPICSGGCPTSTGASIPRIPSPPGGTRPDGTPSFTIAP